MTTRAARSIQAEQRFLAALEAEGARPAYEQWTSTHKPHAIVCRAGHNAAPTPANINKGQGVCRYCSGKSPERAADEFRAVLERRGASLLDPWLGSLTAHRVQCAEGHQFTVRPNHVQQGRRICPMCEGFRWDSFYVVQSPDSGVVKFGITAGGTRRRLAEHRTAGYSEVHRKVVGLSPGAALVVENALKAHLAALGHTPLEGTREYFRHSALPVVLAFVDAATSK